MKHLKDQARPESRSRVGRLAAFAARVGKLGPELPRAIVPWIAQHPRYIPGFLRLGRTVKNSRRVRAREAGRGLQVPPFLVLSVTSRCNLRCSGCYAAAAHVVASHAAQQGLELSGWRRIIDEAVGLGVMAFLVAGGEPFLLPGIARLFRDYPDRLFLVFTNGTAISAEDEAMLRICSNVVVMVSVEGDRVLTDLRRGRGVFEKALGTLDRLQQAGVLTGVAVTVNQTNVDYWSITEHLDELMAHAGPLALFLEEIPAPGDEHPVLLDEAAQLRFRETVLAYRERTTGGAFIILSPHDEEVMGGCVSAGRGFAHITPAGDVTACPVSALATHNLKRASLREALASPLFQRIRANAQLLETAGHPCGLSAHARELEQMTADLGAYRTGIPERPALVALD